MYKNILAGFLFCAISYSVSAQNYVEAYVIDLRGDTLKGKIHVSDNQENYVRINFFEWGDFERPKQYQPGSILEYGFLNEQRFMSFILPDGQMVAGNKAVFLKVLIDRPNLLSLFAFRDKKDTVTYFLKTKEGELIRLFTEDFHNQLMAISNDCEGLKPKGEISKIEYSTLDLANFVNEYNGCLDEDYIVDDSYLSDGIRSFGIRLGTGFGLPVSSSYTLDSPDLLAALSFEYSLSNINSLIFELGISKRTLTYNYYQDGRVSTFFPTQGRVGKLSTSTMSDLNMFYSSIGFKKNIDQFYLILEGKIALNLNSSKNYYSALTTDKDFRNQFDVSLKVKEEIPTAYVTPSISLRAGKAFSILDSEVNFEMGLTYLAIKSTKDQWFEKDEEGEVELQCICGVPYTLYFVSQPIMPKLAIDFSMTVPFYRN